MRSITKRWKFVLPALLLGLLALAGLAYSAAGPNAQLAGQNRVYGGGSFKGPEGLARNFAIDAHANGSVAYGDIEYGGGSHFQHEQVTCLAVGGNRTTIGAIVTQADRSEDVGFWALMILTDNGPATSTTSDASTLQEIGPAGAGWPAGFPYVCPSPSAAAAMFGLNDFTLDGGDVVVQNAAG
jgi:hypothetical protein